MPSPPAQVCSRAIRAAYPLDTLYGLIYLFEQTGAESVNSRVGRVTEGEALTSKGRVTVREALISGGSDNAFSRLYSRNFAEFVRNSAFPGAY